MIYVLCVLLSLDTFNFIKELTNSENDNYILILEKKIKKRVTE